MAELVVIGLSHKTAPVELREQLAIAQDDLPDALGELKRVAAASGLFATATCNRFEVYCSAQGETNAAEDVAEWIVSRGAGDPKALRKSLYIHRGEAAIRHLFRVTSSLDSMVVGEPQILGQVKQAFATAESVGSTDGFLERCMSRALRVAKQVRTQTEIARQPVSVPSVSVQLARKVFGQLEGRSVLLVGAGEMCELAAKALVDQRVSEVHVANRSPDRAAEMARRVGGQAHPLENVSGLLCDVDIVISSTGAPGHVVTLEHVQEAWSARRFRPLLMIDIAVPRDIDPAIGEMSGVYLFDIDDLQQVVKVNKGQRKREARVAEKIVSEQAMSFGKALRADTITPTIVKLRKELIAIKDEELEKAMRGLSGLSDGDAKRVRKLASTLVNRILHQPTTTLKRLAGNGSADEAAEIVEELFGLDSEGSDQRQ